MYIIAETQRTPRKLVPSGGFLSFPVSRRLTKPQADCWLSLSIQPFADVVGCYTCRDRKKKGKNVYHAETPPSCWKESTASQV